MAVRRPLNVQDALWLEMDRPNNLMVVDSVVWTAEPLDWDRVKQVLRERLADRYPVFRSRAVRGDDGRWCWEEVDDFDLDDHLVMVRLPEPGDDRALQELVASQRTVPLDRRRPLWTAFCVDGYRGGSAYVSRTHHAIADGMRMVQLAMSLFDATPEGGPILAPPVRQHAATPRPPGQPLTERVQQAAADAGRQVAEVAGQVGGRVSEVLADPLGTTTEAVTALGGAATGLAGATAEAASRLAGEVVRTSRSALTNPVGATHAAVTSARSGLAGLREALRSSFETLLPGGGPVVDLFSAAPGDIDTVRKLLLGTRNDPAIWTGTAGTRKAVAWSEPLPLDAVKQVAKANAATVNDVLVACTALALHHYLAAHDSRCASVTFMVPVNLKPLDTTLPDELGNSFALVQLELPTDQPDPLAVLGVVKRRMGRIKQGHEAAIAMRIQEVISGLNRTVYEAAVDLLANRALGVLTNVPGPPMPVYFAGTKVEGVVGWAPLSGDQPMSFTIYSYDGKVFVGIACDAGLVPDHHTIVDSFAGAFARLQAATTA